MTRPADHLRYQFNFGTSVSLFDNERSRGKRSLKLNGYLDSLLSKNGYASRKGSRLANHAK
jgi:hypothetical protein